MKKLLFGLILCCVSQFAVSQEKYCFNRNDFTQGCITIFSDSFLYVNKGDFDNYQFSGRVEKAADTIIINKGILRDPIEIVASYIKPIQADSLEIYIVFDTGKPIDFYEVWTNDSLNNYLVLKEGKITLSEIPAYDILLINPILHREYHISIPLKDKLKMGFQYTFVIREPNNFLRLFENECRFISRGNKLILLDENGYLSNLQLKKKRN